MLKNILNYWDLSNHVQFITKTRQEKDMTNCIYVVYDEIETELLGPIELGMVCYQNKTRQQHVQLYRCSLH